MWCICPETIYLIDQIFLVLKQAKLTIKINNLIEHVTKTAWAHYGYKTFGCHFIFFDINLSVVLPLYLMKS